MNANATPLIALALPRERGPQVLLQVALAIAGTLILAVSSKVSVPIGPVYLSLQSLAVMLLAAAFGLRLGVGTVLLYLAEGAAGLPVFQGTPEKGIGLVYMLGGTGGFLAGFVVLAAIVGWAADRGFDRNMFKFFGAVLLADVVMMAMGYAWLAHLIGADKAWQFGVAPFILPELIKVALATAVLPAVWSLVARRG